MRPAVYRLWTCTTRHALPSVVVVLVQAALQAIWMQGLAGKLNDVMSALGGQSVVELAEEDRTRAGDYGYRYLVRIYRIESM